MIINVTSSIRIETSSVPEFTVQRKMVAGDKSKKAGEVYWKNLGHHGTLLQAINKTLDHVVAGSEEEVNLQELRLLVRKHFRRVRRTLERQISEGAKDES